MSTGFRPLLYVTRLEPNGTDKGCVKTFDDTAVSWMITEIGYASFDIPLIAAQEAVACPNPSNLQVAAGVGLIDDQDSVGTFDPQGAAAVA